MKRLIGLLLLTCSCALQANENPYSVPITRGDVTKTMIAYNWWSGEYPSPVVNVQRDKGGWNTITGYSSLRNPVNKKACTVRAGVYHPWTTDKISLISYYSVVSKVNYVVNSAITLEGQKLKKGDKLENEVYLSEGFCSYSVNATSKLETHCLGESKNYQRIEFQSHPSEQWLYLSCNEGYNVFVQDKDLLQQPNTNEGQMTGFGSVSSVNTPQ